jgi:hypothetical protein
MTAHRFSTTAASAVWSNPASGLWSDGADWSTGDTPTASTNVTLADNASLNVAGTLTVNESTLAVAAGAKLSAATLTLTNNGALQLGGGGFAITGALIADGGEIIGTGVLMTKGETNIWANADAYIPNLYMSGVGWTNTGTVNDETNIGISANAGQKLQIVNAASGTLNLLATQSEVTAGLSQDIGQGSVVFTNAGLLTAGSALEFADLVCALDIATVNTGTIMVENGQTLIFEDRLSNDGSIVIGSEANLLLEGSGPLSGSIGGPGTVTLERGTYTAPASFSFGAITIGDIFGTSLMPQAALMSVSGTVTDTGRLLVQNTGMLRLGTGADVTITGGLQLGSGFDNSDSAGTITGAGTLVTTAFSLGGSVNHLDGVLGGGLTWESAGTVQLAGVLTLGIGTSDVVRIINEAGATFTDDGGALLPGPNTGNNVFTNDGTLASVLSPLSGYGNDLDCRVVNAGLILVAGTGGPNETDTGSFVFGGEFVNKSTGFVQIGGGGGLGLNTGAVIQGSVTGTSGGVYLAGGAYTIAASTFDVGTLQAQGETLDTAAINLYESAWGAGDFLNAAGATFTMTGKAGITGHGSVTLENSGLLVRAGAGGASFIDGSLANNGTLAVQAGTLLVGALTGTGLDTIAASATLDISHGIGGGGQMLQFLGAGGTLVEAKPASLASLLDFTVGDHLALEAINATAASISGTVLTVSTSTTSYSFGSAGLLGDGVTLATNGHGDALITVVAAGGHG